MGITENSIEIIVLCAPLGLISRPLFDAALISVFPPFFARHIMLLYPVPLTEGYNRGIVSPGMKYCITFKQYHASSVRPDTSGYIFTLRKVKPPFSPL